MKSPHWLLPGFPEGRLAGQAEINPGSRVSEAGLSWLLTESPSPDAPLRAARAEPEAPGPNQRPGRNQRPRAEHRTTGQASANRGVVQGAESVHTTTRSTQTCLAQGYFPSESRLLAIKKQPTTNPGFPFMLKPIWERFPLTTASGTPCH